LSNFWDELVRKFGPREDIVIIPGAPTITNKYMDHLERRALIPQFSHSRGKMALDVGAGIGRWTSILSEKADHVIGIDISKAMIKIARSKLHKPNVDFVNATAYALPLRSKSVDLSLSCICIQHITSRDKQKRSIKEIARVTKSRILILELMSKTRRIKLTHYPTLIIPKSEYVKTLRNLEVEEISEIGVDFLPFVKLTEDLRNLILSKLRVNVPSYGGSRKQRLIRDSYQILSVFALVFSLPLNRVTSNPSSNLTRHVLLVAKNRMGDKSALVEGDAGSVNTRDTSMR